MFWAELSSVSHLFFHSTHLMSALLYVRLFFSLHSENWTSVAKLALSPPYVLPSFLHPLDKAFPQASTQDIGTVAAKYLTITSSSLSSTGPTIVELSGPKDLSSIEVAKVFESINGGNPVTAVAVDDKDFESTLEKELPKNVAASYSEMMRAINSGKVAWLKEGDVIKERGETDIAVTLREMA